MKHFLPILLLAALMAPQAQADEGISVLQGLKPMNSGDMDNHHGGSGITSIMSNDIDIDQNNHGNSIGGDSYTGGITNIEVSGNSGVTTTIMNSGNQVNISQSNAINVHLH
jgi:hypothetical protein